MPTVPLSDRQRDSGGEIFKPTVDGFVALIATIRSEQGEQRMGGNVDDVIAYAGRVLSPSAMAELERRLGAKPDVDSLDDPAA